MLATIEDFELRHGPPADSEKPQVTALLDDAGALVEAELGELPEGWTGKDADIPAIVKAVCVQVAYRAWSNPDGIAREELGEVSRAYRGGNDADALWLTENEKRLIRRAAGKPRITSVPLETSYSADPGAGVSPLDFWPIKEEA
jgi:hypothetical protein